MATALLQLPTGSTVYEATIDLLGKLLLIGWDKVSLGQLYPYSRVPALASLFNFLNLLCMTPMACVNLNNLSREDV